MSVACPSLQYPVIFFVSVAREKGIFLRIVAVNCKHLNHYKDHRLVSIKVSTLENGLRVATDSTSSVETASVGIWVHAGSRNETPEINGVAHFLEHMAFKGTLSRSAVEIAETIENVGGYLNAYTSREITAYYARVLKEHVPLAIDLLADILQNSVFDPEEMQKERSVILQEIGQTQDTPDDVVFDHFQHTAFPDQPMGFSILGPASNIQAMPRETLIQFMDKQYSPRHMVLAAAGNVDHDQVLQYAQEKCGGFQHKPRQLVQPGIYEGGEFRESKTLEQLHLVLGYEGVSSQGRDHYIASIASSCLGGGMSSRLFQEVREKRGLVYSIYTFASAYHETGSFGVYMGTSEKDGSDILKVVLEELQKSTYSLNETEIQRAKAQLKASILMSYESTSSRVRKLAQNLLFFDRIIPGSEIIDTIESVTLQEAQQFITQMIQSPMTLACLGPVNKVPSFEEIQRYI